MLFSSNIFLFFFLPAVLLGYYGMTLAAHLWRRARPAAREKAPLARNLFLMLASLLFYAWGEPRFVLVMLASILVNNAFGLWVAAVRGHRARRRLAVAAMLCFNLGLLFVFKYLNFALRNLGYLLGPAVPQTDIALPIGISFFTFQAVSYVLDVARAATPVQKNPLYVALYISFFPQLIAGPIVRYQTIEQQLTRRRESLAAFTGGVQRFIMGLGKKVLIANQLAAVADAAFAYGEGLSAAFALLGALSYSLQIYFDFSGYSDMAIGLGRMFGFEFLENFSYPYISASVSEFWRRWHISLGSWFRDYVYVPLGGSRVLGRGRLVFNLLAVWLLTGVWHGAAWTFVAWGLWYFALLTFEKLSGWPARFARGWQRVLYQLFTLVCVCFGWVLFRAGGLGEALHYMAAALGLGGAPLWDDVALLYLRENAFFFAAGLLFCLPVLPWLRRRLAAKSAALQAAGQTLASLALVLVLMVCVSYLVKGAYNPFIYFNF